MNRFLQWTLVSAGLIFAFACGRISADRKAMIEGNRDKLFELRTYIANDGKIGDLHTRFREHTTKLFEKHGIHNVGYWVPADAEKGKNTLIYIVAHESMEAAKKNWKAFSDDPEWKKVYEESHKDGVLVKKVESVYMKPTAYSKIR